MPIKTVTTVTCDTLGCTTPSLVVEATNPRLHPDWFAVAMNAGWEPTPGNNNVIVLCPACVLARKDNYAAT